MIYLPTLVNKALEAISLLLMAILLWALPLICILKENIAAQKQ